MDHPLENFQIQRSWVVFLQYIGVALQFLQIPFKKRN